MTTEEIRRIEDEINARVAEGAAVSTEIMALEDARQAGAMALFGEKYPDDVRVVRMGDFSTELCGGTHLSNTGQVGVCRVVSEEPVAKGVRRISALTGPRALEQIRHTESIVKELTDHKPRFRRGSMLVNHPEETAQGQRLHCAREDFGRYITRYDVRNDRIFCNDFVIFPYFWDVKPGDGGLVVLPGSHKSEFDRPETLFDGGNLGDTAPQYALNITPKAGDVVIITELTTHGALRWQAKDRKRCTLILRYTLQYLPGGTGPLSDTLCERLSPETLELMARGGYQEIKEIVRRDVVTLS